jgi:1,2-diacylglycerol 3-beta-galactosyltransferase
MNLPSNRKPHVVLLFSDTGGGHRSAAEAIVEAIQIEWGDAITTEMVDFFRYYAPPPFNHAPELYPLMVKIPEAWGATFYLTDGRARARAITSALWPYVRRAAFKLIRHHPADLYISVHPLATTLPLNALGKQRPPFLIVVTDLVTTHALWYDDRADLILLPTEMAYERAIANHMPPQKLRVVGLPVSQRFCAPFAGPQGIPTGDKIALRTRLGWPVDRPLVLLVGGGEGMGPLAANAFAIAEAGLDLALVIVAGRNQRLKAELESRRWPVPTFIYGFTREMPDFMRAADVLVTKAGPGTISEALNAGLPLLLYARLPGQEDGNVKFVVRERLGHWAPRPQYLVSILRQWIEQPQVRESFAARARQKARPQAALTIARIVGEQLGLPVEENIPHAGLG